jgi:hypothetical protein
MKSITAMLNLKKLAAKITTMMNLRAEAATPSFSAR